VSPAGASLPIVLVPLGTDEDALDACLAALEAGTPAGTRVWLADDARAGPRAGAIIERWLAGTRLQAAHTRRAAPIGDAAHIDQAVRACGGADVAVLAGDACPAPGWLERLSAGLAQDPAIASATPWCNAGETAAWPRIGEVVPLPAPPDRIARACARLAGEVADLPAAVGHAVLLRGEALRQCGGIDGKSFGSWHAALVDLSLRLAGMGWRNVLGADAFVAREVEDLPADGDMDALTARWPGWHARLATFLMQDPLQRVRTRLQRELAMLDPPPPQADLFASAP